MEHLKEHHICTRDLLFIRVFALETSGPLHYICVLCSRIKCHIEVLPPVNPLEVETYCHIWNLVWQDSRWLHLISGIGMTFTGFSCS